MDIWLYTWDDKTALQKRLVRTLARQGVDDCLILVDNLLTKQRLRRALQHKLRGPAPDIRTLDHWFDDLARLSLDGRQRPGVILDHQTRSFTLNQWLQNHPTPELRAFAAPSPVNAVSDIISDLRKADEPLGRLLALIRKNPDRKKEDLGILLNQYQEMLKARQWADREQIPALLPPIPGHWLTFHTYILYEPGYLTRSRELGIRTMLASLKAKPDTSFMLFQYRPETMPADCEHLCASNRLRKAGEKLSISVYQPENTIFGEKEDSLPAAIAAGTPLPADFRLRHPLYLEEFHNGREELRHALRLIRWKVSQIPAGQPGSRFSDYCILTGNLSDYQFLADPLSRECEVPVTLSRGHTLLSQPVMRRFLLMLSFSQNAFRIDDIYQIFADNQFLLPLLKEDDASKPPNLRSFCQFCREHNFRTLSEAVSGTAPTLERLIARAQQAAEDDPGGKGNGRKLETLQKSKTYYSRVLRQLERFRERFEQPEIQELFQWIAWARELIGTQSEKPSEVTPYLERLESLLQELSENCRRLDLHTRIPMKGFLNLLTLQLQQHYEQTEDFPDAVLIADAGHFTEIHDKSTFLIGLNEGGFPHPAPDDYLRFRYQKELADLLRHRVADPFSESWYRLARLMDNARELFLSRPKFKNNQSVIGSALWQDVVQCLGWSPDKPEKWHWPVPDDSVYLTTADERRHEASLIHGSVAGNWQEKGSLSHHQLTSAICNERLNKEKMGLYDGDLRADVPDDWKALIRAQQKRWWEDENAEDGSFNCSITRLDLYANAPLEYFYRYVLGLRPLHKFQDEAESTHKGILIHRILQDFYTPGAGSASGYPKVIYPSQQTMEAARSRMNTIITSILTENQEMLGYHDSPFPLVLEQNIRRILEGFLHKEIAFKTRLKPEPAGELHPADPQRDKPFCMEYNWKRSWQPESLDVTVCLNGIIDRIEVDAAHQKAFVFDYKTSASGTKKFDEEVNLGLSFQLPVYLQVLLDQGFTSVTGAYYLLPVGKAWNHINWDGFLGDIGCFDESTVFHNARKRKEYRGLFGMNELRRFLAEIMDERIPRLINHMQQGDFHTPFDAPLPYSDYRWIIRYDPQVQASLKQKTTRSWMNGGDGSYYIGTGIFPPD